MMFVWTVDGLLTVVLLSVVLIVAAIMWIEEWWSNRK